MEHDELKSLIPAYALNILDDEEAADLRRHLASCTECRAELASYEAVVDLMPPPPVASPPPLLKQRLMAQIKVAPQSAPSPRPTIWRQLRLALGYLLTGPRWQPVALLFVIALLVSNIMLRQQLEAPDANSWRRIRLAGTEEAPEATGIIYISADGRKGTLIVDRLPQLGPDEQYQLWLIQDGQRASGAVFTVDSGGYLGVQIDAPLPLQEYGAFGVTIEPHGGSPGPTGQKVLGSSL